MQSKNQQKIQEAMYEFPYHYTPNFDHGIFSQTRNLSWGYEYISYLSFISKEVGRLEFDSLLDVGCGDGRFLCELYKKFPEKNLSGVDISERAINYARAFNPHLRYLNGDICDENLLQEKYDVITLIEVLEHIPPKEIPKFLDGLSFYLKESGNLILTVPSKNIKTRPKHFQHFDLQSLKKTLSSHFVIEEYYFINSLSLRTRIINQILTNELFILNNKKLVTLLYRYYNKNLLIADSHICKRIYLNCKKKRDIS